MSLKSLTGLLIWVQRAVAAADTLSLKGRPRQLQRRKSHTRDDFLKVFLKGIECCPSLLGYKLGMIVNVAFSAHHGVVLCEASDQGGNPTLMS